MIRASILSLILVELFALIIKIMFFIKFYFNICSKSSKKMIPKSFLGIVPISVYTRLANTLLLSPIGALSFRPITFRPLTFRPISFRPLTFRPISFRLLTFRPTFFSFCSFHTGRKVMGRNEWLPSN